MSPERPSPPYTVVLADDHQAFREGLARSVAAHDRLELAAELGDGAGALAAIERLRPDVAVLDLEMPGLDGLEVCRRLGRDPAARTRVLIVTATLDKGLAEAAAEAGAADLVGKEASRREICEAIVRVAAG